MFVTILPWRPSLRLLVTMYWCETAGAQYVIIVFSKRSSGDALTKVGSMLTKSVEQALGRAFSFARERGQRETGLEHCLLALCDEPDVHRVLVACGVDVAKLTINLLIGLNDVGDESVAQEIDDPKPSAELARVVHRAEILVQSGGLGTVSGIHLLLALFAEPASRSVYLLRLQNVTGDDVAKLVSYEQGPQP